MVNKIVVFEKFSKANFNVTFLEKFKVQQNINSFKNFEKYFQS